MGLGNKICAQYYNEFSGFVSRFDISGKENEMS